MRPGRPQSTRCPFDPTHHQYGAAAGYCTDERRLPMLRHAKRRRECNRGNGEERNANSRNNILFHGVLFEPLVRVVLDAAPVQNVKPHHDGREHQPQHTMHRRCRNDASAAADIDALKGWP